MHVCHIELVVLFLTEPNLLNKVCNRMNDTMRFVYMPFPTHWKTFVYYDVGRQEGKKGSFCVLCINLHLSHVQPVLLNNL